MGASYVKLQYVDDNISGYYNIWNNVKTDITTAVLRVFLRSLQTEKP